MTPRQRLYGTVRGQACDRVPVTPIFMAWAAHFIGRSYRDYYLHGLHLATAQVAVARALNTDQVSAISDPWREAEAFGMELDYPPEGVGIPRRPLLTRREDVANLRVPAAVGQARRMQDRVDAVARMAGMVGNTHSVMGWVEAALAEYVDLRGLEEAMLDLVDEPGVFHRAAEVITDNAIRFARAQIDAGADCVGIGDAAASLVGPALYREHVLPWEKRLVQAVHAAGALVKLHICGNTLAILADVARTGADIIDVDWMVPLGEARRLVGPEVTLAGNFDPAGVLLRGTPAQVTQAARQCLREAGDRFILQPGCEVPPGTPVSHLQAFCPGEGWALAGDLRRG